jgi:hypothetical protein
MGLLPLPLPLPQRVRFYLCAHHSQWRGSLARVFACFAAICSRTHAAAFSMSASAKSGAGRRYILLLQFKAHQPWCGSARHTTGIVWGQSPQLPRRFTRHLHAQLKQLQHGRQKAEGCN